MIVTDSGFNIFSYAAKCKRPLILDGAMGSVLRKKYAPSGALWMSALNITAPEKITQLHAKYIKAGADIITTNTFRTNPAAFEEYSGKISNPQYVYKSVLPALKAAKGKNVLVAGSNPPAEDCYKAKREISSKKLSYNHHKHINLLMDSGVDFILNETQSHFDEISVISRYCAKNNIPYIISLYLTEDLKLLSGEGVHQIIKFILEYLPLAISINCVKPEIFFRFLNRVKLKFNWGAYLNCGTGAQTDDTILSCIHPAEYLNSVKKMLPFSPSLVGACCGSTPLHIKLIKEYFDEKC